ncbi:MAG: helix-turn-helix transcriptional regulator [Acidobacteria bacterium]|nr:helix-turn-helix transcriptional regulator [Acidobacteriota bacterium]
MISVVAERFEVHPQTLRLYEREGLVKPSRTQGNTRLYSEDDLERLSFILNLTRELGVNLAGVEIIMNLRRRIERMQEDMDRFISEVRHELSRRRQEGPIESSRALVKVPAAGRAFKTDKG